MIDKTEHQANRPAKGRLAAIKLFAATSLFALSTPGLAINTSPLNNENNNSGDIAASTAMPNELAVQSINDQLVLEHDLYWKGFHVVTLETTINLNGRTYQTEMSWRTRGILSVFVDGKTTATAMGEFDEAMNIFVDKYLSSGKWGDKEYIREIAYDDNGNPTIVQDINPWANDDDDDEEAAERRKKRRDKRRNSRRKTVVERIPVPEDLKANPDPISLALVTLLEPTRMIKSTKLASSDDAISPVSGREFHSYDGRRTLSYQLGCQGELDTLKKSSRSPHYGESYACTVTVNPTGGYRKETVINTRTNEVIKTEGGEENTATLWYLPTQDGTYMIPIRGNVEMEQGEISLYLKSANKVLVAPSAQSGQNGAPTE